MSRLLQRQHSVCYGKFNVLGLSQHSYLPLVLHRPIFTKEVLVQSLGKKKCFENITLSKNLRQDNIFCQKKSNSSVAFF